MWVLHEVGAEAEGRAACWEARMTAGLLELAALRKSPIPANSENMIGKCNASSLLIDHI